MALKVLFSSRTLKQHHPHSPVSLLYYSRPKQQGLTSPMSECHLIITWRVPPNENNSPHECNSFLGPTLHLWAQPSKLFMIHQSFSHLPFLRPSHPYSIFKILTQMSSPLPRIPQHFKFSLSFSVNLVFAITVNSNPQNPTMVLLTDHTFPKIIGLASPKDRSCGLACSQQHQD